MHGLLINLIKLKTVVEFKIVSGLSLVFADYIISVLLCSVVIYIFGRNKFLRYLLGIKD